MTGRKLFLFTLFLLITSLALTAQTSSAGEDFRLIHSDKLFLNKVNGENILELNGKVHFYYGDTEFRSHQAIIFEKQKIARLIGNVRVRNDTLNTVADSISYYRITEFMNLGGNIIITEQKTAGVFNQMAADFGSYDKLNDVISARGNVRALSAKDKARASANLAHWDRKNGYAYLLENPQLWSEDRDTLYIRSERMEFFDDDRKVIATFDVLAQSKDYTATSDFLLYFLKDEKAIFQGEPKFTSGFADATAGEFYLFFKEKKLYMAELKDSCVVWFAEEKGKPKTNWVKADFISMNITDDNLDDFEAENKVTYFYQQEQEGKKDFFSNSASGSFLSATFGEDGKLESMMMKQGVKGTYIFENNP
ncbi:MAG: OstA-like protein [Candidatus Cloacimonadaceae bacterium]